MSALFVENLSVLDFTALHPGRGLVGESWSVDLELHGKLDEQGMVLDFGEVKRAIKREIDQLADHRLVIPVAMKDLQITELPDGNLRVQLEQDGELLLAECPPAALLRLSSSVVDRDGLAAFLVSRLRAILPANVEKAVIRLREESIEGACFQYSHGLRQHDGPCQRIAHGHRSRLEIEEDGVRNPTLEDRWAGQFHDAYIGSTDDLVYTSRPRHLRFGYVSREGRFLLELPRRRVYLIDSPSTIELIAFHVCDALKRLHPQRRYRVKAYEGIGKGAIAVL